MSDAQPPQPVSENGVSVAQEQLEEVGSKVFAGNLSYATTDEGLKAFFAPVANDILSAQIIMRGPRSAGYGFVSLATHEAAEKAVESLNGMELDGRNVIVEIAKPSDQKDKENKERKKSRRPGRRGAKAVPGEVTDAEANGDVPKVDDGAAVPESSEAAKPKKKKKSIRKPKKSTPAPEGDAAGEPSAEGEEAPAVEGSPVPKKPRTRKPRAPRTPRPTGEAPPGEPSKTMLFVANLGFNVDDDGLHNLFTEAGVSVISARVVRWRWDDPGRARVMVLLKSAVKKNKTRVLSPFKARKLMVAPLSSKLLSMRPRRMKRK